MPKEGVQRLAPQLVWNYSETPPLASAAFQKKLDLRLETELVRSESLTLVQNGETFPYFMKVLKNAQKFFLLNVLSFSCDAVTEPFILALEEKSKSGVEVRVIVNDLFSYLSFSCLKRLKNAGVEVLKTRTHSSYALNDQEELLIGSQSVARMFFLADGFNSLDRDMMLYAKGGLSTDALKDFISLWSENSEEWLLELKAFYRKQIKKERNDKIRGEALYEKEWSSPERLCRFITQKPETGIRDTELLWSELISASQKKIAFSGVQVDTADGEIASLMKEKSKKIAVEYLGNGYLSGNGELTMVLDEWAAELENTPGRILGRLLNDLKEWDRYRVAKSYRRQYQELQKNSRISVFTYFNFIHYKVWSFDGWGTYVGSANLDENKLGKLSEAGVFCIDENLGKSLSVELQRDHLNSTIYENGAL